MKKLVLMVLLLLALVVATPVLAQTYITSIIVTENASNSYSMLPIAASIGNEYLAGNGFITSSGLDTRVLKVSSQMYHMLADDKTLFCSVIGAGESSVFHYTFGNSALDSFPVIVGYGGYVTVPDDGDLELRGDFVIEVSGHFNTDNASGKYILHKENAFSLFVSPTVSGNITVTITGGNSLTALNVLSGEYDIIVSANVTHWWIEVDTVLKDIQVLSANVTDNSNSWSMFAGNSMSYVEYIKVFVR